MRSTSLHHEALRGKFWERKMPAHRRRALEEEHLRAKLIVVADGLKRDDFSPNRLGIPKSGRL
jgi:hypothetical protein